MKAQRWSKGIAVFFF